MGRVVALCCSVSLPDWERFISEAGLSSDGGLYHGDHWVVFQSMQRDSCLDFEVRPFIPRDAPLVSSARRHQLTRTLTEATPRARCGRASARPWVSYETGCARRTRPCLDCR